MGMRWKTGLGLAAVSGLCACPLPDFGIQVITEDINNSPVKLIEPIGLSPSQHCECDPENCQDDDPSKHTGECPSPEVIGLPQFLDPNLGEFRFCKCGEGLEDTPPLPVVEFFAEDQDRDPDSDEPKDQLYAAILLNADLEVDNPKDFVAYLQDRSPTQVLPRHPNDGYSPLNRPTPFVRTIRVGDTEGWDLCGDDKARQGFNTLTVLITDRFWNEVTIEAIDDMAEAIIQEIGVVDVANGATFDTASYTFYCSSIDDPTNPVSPGDEGNDPFGCVARCQDPDAEG
jgi:hypothetical protein